MRPLVRVCVTPVVNAAAAQFTFDEQKTMYAGKTIATDDLIFIFASENEGGKGLVAAGVVTSVEAIPRRPGKTRQTPQVSITVRNTGLAKRIVGRADLKPFSNWDDRSAETELNFKLYRQATNKIVRISDTPAAFLHACS